MHLYLGSVALLQLRAAMILRPDEVAELAATLQRSTDRLALNTEALNAYDGFARTVAEVADDLQRCGLTDFSDPLVEALGVLGVRMGEVT